MSTLSEALKEVYTDWLANVAPDDAEGVIRLLSRLNGMKARTDAQRKAYRRAVADMLKEMTDSEQLAFAQLQVDRAKAAATDAEINTESWQQFLDVILSFAILWVRLQAGLV